MRNGALSIVRRLRQAGFTAVWAGGCVRDRLMGKMPKDYDIATSALPEQMLALFPKSNLAGKAFGVIRTTARGHVYEIATFRADHDYHDGRHPRSISYTDIRTDAQRRDFTINALFYDPLRNRVLDYVGGRKDITRGLVRCVGRPKARFQEDYLRILRAIRFSVTLGFRIAPATRKAMIRNVHLLAETAQERIRDELSRTLLEALRPGDALRTLDRLGILDVVLPELTTRRFRRRPGKSRSTGKNPLSHTIRMLNVAPAHDEVMAFAILLHSLSAPLEGGEVHRPGTSGGKLSLEETILRRLCFPRRQMTTILDVLEIQSLLRKAHVLTRPELRRLAGSPAFPAGLELYRRNSLAERRVPTNFDFLSRLLPGTGSTAGLPSPLINGRDVMQCGVPEGPEVGRWCRLAYDRQLDDERKTREEILTWISEEIRKDLKQS